MNIQPVYSTSGRPEPLDDRRRAGQKLNIITTQLSLPDALARIGSPEHEGRFADLQFLKGILERRMSAEISSQGPIGIAQLSGEAAREGPLGIRPPDVDGEPESGYLQPAARFPFWTAA